MAPRVLVVAGTRPEAIKLSPVILALRGRPGLETVVCATGQHRELLSEPFGLFGIAADLDLALRRPKPSKADFLDTARSALSQTIGDWKPRLVVVQGDTATALAGAEAATANGVAVAHVEAGLRSGDPNSPYPEELYRRAISRLATLHFAPTGSAREALLAEGLANDQVHLTGNSGIDALHAILARLKADRSLAADIAQRFAFLDPQRPLILATTHRRENLGAPLDGITAAVRRLAQDHGAQVVLPVHPNPTVRMSVNAALGAVPHVHLTEPLSYLEFVHILRRARMALTDSGGVQEEAPALGVPALVLRDTTERPESIATGNTRLVGTDADRIVEAAARLLRDDDAHAMMAEARSPYGDGHAAQRIAAIIRSWFVGTMLDQPLKVVPA